MAQPANTISGDEILLQRDKGIATLVFNRPESRNAMNPAMRDALITALDLLAADVDIQAVVLKGQGGSFIAGGDLQAFAQTLDMERPARRKNFVERVTLSSALVEKLVNFPKPLIAVIEGDAAGAGISIALACDFVLATENARFTFAHAHVGLALDLGLSYFLPRAVGSLQARRLAMLGAKISGAEAYELGMVSSLLEVDALDQSLATLLSSLKKMPATALAGIKRELAASCSASLQQQLALEAEAVADCAATEAFEQRVAAFVRR